MRRTRFGVRAVAGSMDRVSFLLRLLLIFFYIFIQKYNSSKIKEQTQKKQRRNVFIVDHI